jgi:hypothetical protein
MSEAQTEEQEYQRRDPRVEVALDVTLQLPTGERHYTTSDISYRGAFISCEEPLPLRKLVRFQVVDDVSTEPLQLLGLVANRVNPQDAAERGRTTGMGIQLFSMGIDNHERWRELVRREYDKDPYARRIVQLRELPSIKVQANAVEELRNFAQNDLMSGQSFLRTAELHPPGSTIVIELVHPDTGETFPLESTVEQVVETPIERRGVQLSFPPVEEDLRSSLQSFLEEGASPA